MTGTILPVDRTAHPITWTLAARAGVDSKTVMKANRPVAAAATDLPLAPPILAVWLSVFRPCFTAPVWNHVLVLVAGAVLAPGKRTVTQALRVMGLGDEPGFGRYHEVLNRARWDARGLARRLLLHVLDGLLPTGPVVIGIDDTIERRWGARIKARGIYRDPVRSSKGHFVKTSGLRWLSLMVIVPIPWAARRWALPFLTILAPSARWSEAHGKRHKTLTTWARQAILQTKRWLPNRELVIVGDNGFAALDLLAAVRRHVCVITRLRLDANLFKPAPARKRNQRGRPPLKGKVLVWYHSGIPPVPIRWVLVRDPLGEHEPQAFLSTDLTAAPATILQWFVFRWRVETTFQEVRAHLGVETQRQWSDLAILRTTPVLLGLFSMITVWASGLAASDHQLLRPHAAAWYDKKEPTFTDAIAAVRRVLWSPPDFSMSRPMTDAVIIPARLLKRLVQTLSLAA